MLHHAVSSGSSISAENHLHFDACCHEILDSVRGVVSRRVKHRKNTHESEGLVIELYGHSKRLVASLKKAIVACQSCLRHCCRSDCAHDAQKLKR